MKKRSLIFSIFVFVTLISFGQNEENHIIRGSIIDKNTNEVLPYANIVILQKYKGTVSNEKGSFSFDLSPFSAQDTLSFQFIGYKSHKVLVNQTTPEMTVYLEEDMINLSEAFVYGNPPNPKDIIKKVVENKDKNYKYISSNNQVFIRSRDITDIENLSTNVKKLSIDQLDEDLIQNTVKKVPRHITSYTDFLGNLYFFEGKSDSLKVDPKRTVSLKEEDIAEFEQIGKIFENLFKDTGEEEYWKIKSGIFGQKLDIQEEENDSITETPISNDSSSTRYMRSSIRYWLEYSSIENTDEWEFLYSPGKYKYTLTGGTRVNGEDVFIIDFTPKSGGEYIGRVYVSTESYALIKADYEYAAGKTGRDIHLLGIGYTEDYFKASIYFEKIEDSYQLKYFSKKAGKHFSINRSLQLIKKRKRWLLNKTLKEMKLRLKMAANQEESVEVLFLNHEKISNESFAQFNQPKKMKIQYIEQFHDDLWIG
ncbi:carboxypeptidase-like regulatory domain-containing protein [Lentimicrobium sp. S6]|uniref:carboxypeptidase-like regulatory domain-containing protein n=1 Tax=Lentimicrobium sp. S6 TaxID=2735872 RepID=UPI00155673E8|nr:carboxypeptidase-like regulatory domain-containing protein [Lentimicrobium sp. S6]NPD46649.1 hypothetical protein [Lentimicrobium sp. S6]